MGDEKAMNLERAVEVAIEAIGELDGALDSEWSTHITPEQKQAAATLRAFLEKGLPFYRAAEVHAKWLSDQLDRTDVMVVHSHLNGDAAMVRAYRLGT